MIAVDIGNSQAKFGYFSCQSLQSRFPLPTSCIRILHNTKKNERGGNLFDATKLKSIADWLQNIQNCNNWHIAITASNCKSDSLIDELVSLMPDGRFNVLTNDKIPIAANVDSPSKIGIDRLLDALAATKFIENNPQNDLSNNKISNNKNNLSSARIIETIIIVDAGTAITIDVVKINKSSKSPIFEGGAILSGLKTLFVTLNQSVSHLPEVKISDANLSANWTYPAKNTESAIATGILGSLISTINFFAKKIESNNSIKIENQKIPIIFTGGDAEIIKKLYDKEFPNCCSLILPNLTLTGIAITTTEEEKFRIT
jgi:type III pantothenate kinase